MSRESMRMQSSRALARRGVVAVLFAASACACGGDDFAQLVVLVRSDLPSDLVTGVSISTLSPDRSPRSAMTQAGWSFPISHGLLWDGEELQPVDVEARALGAGTAPVATAAMTTRFVAGETRLVTLDLTTACAGYACEGLCVVGRCVAGFERETPEFGGGAFPALDVCDGSDNDDDGATDEDADHTSQATCGSACARCEQAVCVDGQCLPGRVEDVRASNASVCALHESGAVTCWGANFQGELGRLAAADRSLSRAQPKSVIGLPAVRRGTLSAGSEHFCAIVEPEGEVACWGSNELGQLGANDPIPGSAVVRTGVRALRVDAGGYYTCAIDLDGAVWCWGDNWAGQLDGVPSMAESPAPVPAGVTGASAIAAGTLHTCAIVGGDVSCWGDNEWGQLGAAPRTAVVRGALEIEAGTHHTCAIVGADRHVECWGSNEFGELGTTGFPTTPVSLSLTNVVQLSSSVRADAEGVDAPSHTCARTGDGAVYCWGPNESMQVGAGATVGPQRIDRLMGVARSVAAGGYHTSVVIDHDVWTWGSNVTGQWGAWSIVPFGGMTFQRTEQPVRAVLP